MCPPGVDQTMRTAQRWQLIAPRIKQSKPLDTDERVWSTSIHDAVFNPKGVFDAWSKLAQPVIPSTSAKATPSPSASTAEANKHTVRSGMEKLPVELMLMILESGDLSKSDIMALALASPALRPIIISHIRSSYMKVAAPWAGTPIAVLGNYSLDLPPSFMEDGEVFETFATWPQVQATTPRWRRPKNPARRYFWRCAEFSKPVTPQTEEQGWTDALTELGNQNTHYSLEEIGDIDDQLSRSILFPEDKEWVLRNLTSKEYYVPQPFPKARNKPRTRLCSFNHYPNEIMETARPDVLGFDHVLLLRTCWTSIYGRSERKGKWAGHCFDIVTADAFDHEGREGWVDVSKKLLKEAKVYWDGA